MTRDELIQTLDGLLDRNVDWALWHFLAYQLTLRVDDYLIVKRSGLIISELDGRLITRIETASGNLCIYAYSADCDTEVYLSNRSALTRVTYNAIGQCEEAKNDKA